MTSTTPLRLRRVAPQSLSARQRDPVDPQILSRAAEIVDDVRKRGAPALRAFATSLDGLACDAPLMLDRRAIVQGADCVAADDIALLERTGERIARFAEAQRDSLSEVDVDIPGGRAGHTIEPIERAGCYAPGGRYPLPSSLMMTAVTARAAGCRRVVVATPNPQPIMLAAAQVAGVDALIPLGGAHAIAALAFGFDDFEPSDMIVGPGNAWVTAAKHLVSRWVGIDMLAGPSELVVFAGDSSNPSILAADLLAQAEHDVDASAVLVTTSATLADRVDDAMTERLASLPTATVARASLEANGMTIVCASMDEAIQTCDELAPEHLQILTKDAQAISRRFGQAGAVFIGQESGEVLGDYGLGPNHALPTGGTARFSAGLSVLHFLRARTWMRIDDDSAPLDDVVRLARLERLEGHARAAESRIPTT